MLDDRIVPVVTTELGIAIGCEHFEEALVYFENRDIKSSATEVINGDFFFALLLETIGQSGCSRLVDDSLHIETGDFSGGLRCVALRIVEVGRNSDDRFGDGFTQLGLGIRFQLPENHRRNFLRAVSFAFAGDFHFDMGVTIGSFHYFVGSFFLLIVQLVELASD